MSGRDDEERPDLEGDEDIESREEEDSEEPEEEEYADDLDEEEVAEYDDSDEDLKAVDEVLNHRDSNARALAIRRAIEERMEAKRLSRDLDYLDLDLDTDD